ncbi:membrane spanning protein [Staphylococcus agnetis]|uniref:DUF443 family protein n=1 Tax=Staphylococcus agnetis TaxID=985762 RepID=UPI000DFA7CDA|nr:DUF443 family protein [Staphylococcus agnetis]SUK14614.1 membrane spanning protein [Staphylococcus agnetis]
MNKHKAMGHVENLNKNLRYKIWKSDEAIFLVDLQKNILPYLFPMINWLPLNAYKLSEEEYHQYVSKKMNTNNSSAPAYIGAGLAVFLSSVLRPIVNKTMDTIQFSTGLLIVMVSLVLVAIMQVIIWKRSEISWFKSSKKQYKLRILNTLKTKLLIISGYLMGLFALSMTLTIILQYNDFNFIIGIILIIFLTFFSFLSYASVKVGVSEAVILKKE